MYRPVAADSNEVETIRGLEGDDELATVVHEQIEDGAPGRDRARLEGTAGDRDCEGRAGVERVEVTVSVDVDREGGGDHVRPVCRTDDLRSAAARVDYEHDQQRDPESRDAHGIG